MEWMHMWLFTPDGFFSVVTADEFDYPLQVRARSGADLDRLRTSHCPELGETVRVPGRDYPVRAFTTHDDLARCLTRIAASIDYDNFKNEVSQRQGHGRARIYGKIWGNCLAISSEDEAA